MSFDISMAFVERWEGGWVDDCMETYLNRDVEELTAVLRAAMDLRLAEKAGEFYKPYVPENNRGCPCEVEGCVNPAYAKGLCNAHYIRKRKGNPLDAPLRVNRGANAACQTCGAPRGGKGGWGLCSKHYRRLRRRVIKKALIAAMGGVCEGCGKSYHWAVYDFHHVISDEKETSFGVMIEVCSTEEIAAEMAKCNLLCANCHRTLHAEEFE